MRVKRGHTPHHPTTAEQTYNLAGAVITRRGVKSWTHFILSADNMNNKASKQRDNNVKNNYRKSAIREVLISICIVRDNHVLLSN